MIIRLDDLPDCASCQDPTKRVTGRAIDLDGPGVCNPIYDCRNKDCRRSLNARLSYLIRREFANERRNNHEKRERTD